MSSSRSLSSLPEWLGRSRNRRGLGLVLALLVAGPAAQAATPAAPSVATPTAKPPGSPYQGTTSTTRPAAGQPTPGPANPGTPTPPKPSEPKPPRPAGPRPPAVPIDQIPALFETDPVAGPRDAADDPAIWINPWDRSQSLVIGTDKSATNLEVYDLTGHRLQRIPDASGSLNNVDVRYGFPLGGEYVDIVVTGGGDIAVYKIDPFTRQLVDITAGTIKPSLWAWGICLYRSNISGLFYAFAQAVDNGLVEQLELFDNGFGRVAARSVRGPWDIHPEPVKVEDGEVEACVVDDITGDYYVGEQDIGVWRYGAEPTASTLDRTLVVSTYLVNGGAMVPDLEGIAVIHDDFGTFLLTSSQGDSSFGLYSVDPLVVPYPLVRKFRITGGPYADGCSITDGLDATSLWLGPEFPHGLFVCQDDRNTAPGTAGTQNFKFVPLERIIPGINPYFM